MAGNEIVERLRRDWPHPDRQTVNEAAATIESLQAEVERYWEALEYIRRQDGKDMAGLIDWQRTVNRIQEVATSALTATDEKAP